MHLRRTLRTKSMIVESKYVQKSQRGEIDTLVVDNQLGQMEIALFGAHILSYTPHKDGRERLWVSPHAFFNGTKPIRGGIPLCWPWFSDNHGKASGELPSHGFLRSQIWQLKQIEQIDQQTRLTLQPSFSTGPGFDHNNEVSLIVTVGEQLTVELTTTNLEGNAINFNAALHSYFHVDDIGKTELFDITGSYIDKLQSWRELVTPTPYGFTTEIDRIHLTQDPQTTIVFNGDKTVVKHVGHDSIVVWNPWSGCASMADMDPFAYKRMVCVETAITQNHTLAPNESHTLTQIIS